MSKILIADDEPLVLVGMQSMINWAELGAEVCATAHNGQQALALIEQHRPDVVITDIKMPLMSGLEVAKACREKYGDIPVFIILTSFEEFSFAREAMHQGAVEYLIKLELTPDALRAAVQKALESVARLSGTSAAVPAAAVANAGLNTFRDRFFAKLYNNLFDSSEQFLRQAENLGLEFDADVYAAAACAIGNMREMPVDKQLTLCSSTVQMVCDTLEKFVRCVATTMDMRHFHILFFLQEEQAADGDFLPRLMRHAADTVQRYFSVHLLCGIGPAVAAPLELADSVHGARCMLLQADESRPVLSAHDGVFPADELFDFSLYRADLTRAFEELDDGALYDAITRIIDQLDGHPSRHLQAKDAASYLLYMARTLLPDGEETLANIFDDAPDGCLLLYKYAGTGQCCDGVRRLRDGLCEVLRSEHKNYKRRLIENVTDYIRKNLSRRLTLNEVAAAFSFSPNYLSQLFAKYAEHGFVETITHEKISAAKAMLADGQWKIYEIAEKLGYESAFYFSRVFKKEVGVSPREYINNLKG